jgi:hypothetical protein
MMDDSMTARRAQAAQGAFENYDFQNTRIAKLGGWSLSSPGCDMTRTIVLGALAGTCVGENRACFTVHFKNNGTPDVLGAYCINERGTIIGAPRAASIRH